MAEAQDAAAIEVGSSPAWRLSSCTTMPSYAAWPKHKEEQRRGAEIALTRHNDVLHHEN